MRKDINNQEEQKEILLKDFELIPNDGRMGLKSDVIVKGNKLYLVTGELIANMNDDGKLVFEESYKEKLSKQFGEFYKEFKMDSKEVVISKENLSKPKLKEEKTDTVSQKSMKEEELVEKIEETTNRKITACTKITDNTLLKELPSFTKGEYNDIIITYCKDNDLFQIEGIRYSGNGEIKTTPLSEMKPSKAIHEQIISISKDGKQINEERTKAIIEPKNIYDTTSLALDFTSGKRIEVKQLEKKKDKDGSVVNIARDVQTKTQKPSQRELEEAINEQENDRLDEVISDATKVIILKDGKEVTYKEMAEKYGVSEAEFEKYYEQTDGIPEERLETVEEEFNEQVRRFKF